MQEITEQDADTALSIYNASFEKKWHLEDFKGLLDKDSVSGFIIEDKAFILYQYVREEAEIITIAVKEKYHRRGLASLMLQALKGRFSRIFLEVNENNIPAVSFYIKEGFTEISRRKKYYNGKDNAIAMKYEKF